MTASLPGAKIPPCSGSCLFCMRHGRACLVVEPLAKRPSHVTREGTVCSLFGIKLNFES